jgi:hypothetical protein
MVNPTGRGLWQYVNALLVFPFLAPSCWGSDIEPDVLLPIVVDGQAHNITLLPNEDPWLVAETFCTGRTAFVGQDCAQSIQGALVALLSAKKRARQPKPKPSRLPLAKMSEICANSSFELNFAFERAQQQDQYLRTAHPHLRDSSLFRQLTFGKVALEIGGPTHKLFGQSMQMELYPHLARCDNVNPASNTLWETNLRDQGQVGWGPGGVQYVR